MVERRRQDDGLTERVRRLEAEVERLRARYHDATLPVITQLQRDVDVLQEQRAEILRAIEQTPPAQRVTWDLLRLVVGACLVTGGVVAGVVIWFLTKRA